MNIYGRRSAFNVRKIAWFAGELGIDYEHIELGGSFGGLDVPEYRELKPRGVMPLIDGNGVVVWGGHSVLVYLA